jgi:hypothetical protein
MSKVVTAEYDATENVLRLAEPLEGFDDHSNLIVTVETPMPRRESLAEGGALSKEAGESLARAVNELFPPWN